MGGEVVRPLGDNQKSVLRALARHGSWHEGCGWTWNGAYGTRRIMEALRKRGLVTRRLTSEDPDFPKYYRAEYVYELVREGHDPKCFQCKQRMGRGTEHPIGDELDEERVCAACAKEMPFLFDALRVRYPNRAATHERETRGGVRARGLRSSRAPSWGAAGVRSS